MIIPQSTQFRPNYVRQLGLDGYILGNHSQPKISAIFRLVKYEIIQPAVTLEPPKRVTQHEYPILTLNHISIVKYNYSTNMNIH